MDLNLSLVNSAVVLYSTYQDMEIVEKTLLKNAQQWLTPDLQQHNLCEQGTHPDYYTFLLQDKITLDSIREWIDWVSRKPRLAKRKITVISLAERMNIFCANAMLKTLEELPSDSLCLLISRHPSLLPATLRSRCCWIKDRSICSFLDKPSDEIKRDFFEMIQNPFSIPSKVEKWPSSEITVLLDHFYLFWRSVGQEKLDLQSQPNYWETLDYLVDLKQQIQQGRALNTQLVMESLVINAVKTYNQTSLS